MTEQKHGHKNENEERVRIAMEGCDDEKTLSTQNCN